MPAATANTHVATTAFVATEIAALTYKANLASPAFTGTPTAPTAASGTANTQIATTAFVSSAVSAVPSGQIQSQVFAATGTWTAPAGVTRVRATVVGGGGGAAANNNDDRFAQGGYGGYGVGVYTVVPSTTYTITVGAGGNGSTLGGGSGGLGTSGTAGQQSSFGSFLICSGGGGGVVPSGLGPGTDGANGSATGATLRASRASYAINGPILGGMPTTAPSGSAVAFSTSGTSYAGAGGNTDFSYGSGGIGGAVLLEWVG